MALVSLTAHKLQANTENDMIPEKRTNSMMQFT